jgi:hypothetical protein
MKMGNREIGRFLHLKAEIQNLKSKNAPVQFEVSDFGFEMQESSDFTIPLPQQQTQSCWWLHGHDSRYRRSIRHLFIRVEHSL